MSGRDPLTRTVALAAPVHLELQRLTQAVALKRLEFENAQLRAELAVRRVVEELGLGGQRVSVDLDGGHITIQEVPESDE